MGSLGVLDVFCTVFECATTSRSKFKILSIFAIFRFSISGFWQFDHRNFDDFSFVGSKIFFFQKVSSCNSFRKKILTLVCIISFPTAILVFSPNFPYIDLWANFHLWVYHGIFYGSGNFSSKSMESHLSNALSNAFIALLVAEISSFQFQKSLSSHLCRAFSFVDQSVA